MKNLRDILAGKGDAIHSIKPEATVHEALEKLAAYNIGALLVLDDDNKLVGIFSERDYARNGELKDKRARDTKVMDMMTTHICRAEPDMQVDEVMAMMTRVRCRHIPILKNEELIGMVSIGDAVKAAIGEKEFMIEQLERYISGGL